MSISVRRSTYRRESGFLICGRDTVGRHLSIFSPDELEARYIARQIKRGEPWQFGGHMTD